MTRLFTAAVALLMPLLGGACGTDHVTIRVSAESRHAIAEAVPPSEYSFLVSADSAPSDVDDLKERDLVVCGYLGRNELVQLMTAPESQGTLLFRSAIHCHIDPNLESGEMHTSEDMTVMFPGGEGVALPVEKVIRGRNDAGAPLLASCMENISEGAVLLLDKDLGGTEPETLVRLVFR